VEEAIRGALQAQFPEDAVLGEEGGRSAGSSEMLWIVDPIDGTQCFLDNIPCWCVSIGLVNRRRIVGGLIYDPLHDELFVADTGTATCNGRTMRPSSATDFSLGMVEIGWSTRVAPAATVDFIAALLEAGGIYHRGGSGALALAYVADGRYLAYFEAHMQIWDSCAGAALVSARCLARPKAPTASNPASMGMTNRREIVAISVDPTFGPWLAHSVHA